jgi:hypothetical protein
LLEPGADSTLQMAHRDEIWGGGWTADPNAAVESVIRVYDLRVGTSGSRAAGVWWSDGSCGDAPRWFEDEILSCKGDLIGKSRAQLAS